MADGRNKLLLRYTQFTGTELNIVVNHYYISLFVASNCTYSLLRFPVFAVYNVPMGADSALLNTSLFDGPPKNWRRQFLRNCWASVIKFDYVVYN